MQNHHEPAFVQRTVQELEKYDEEVKSSLDVEGMLVIAKEEGIKIGEEKEKEIIAKNQIDLGLENDQIVKATGLIKEKIENLREKK